MVSKKSPVHSDGRVPHAKIPKCAPYFSLSDKKTRVLTAPTASRLEAISEMKSDKSGGRGREEGEREREKERGG